ncbi:MAG: hypothetical protein ACLQM8_28305 [Limisphaerales bacterium]
MGNDKPSKAWSNYSRSVTEVLSSYFADRQRFPEGAIEFDHALLMRNLKHEWHQADDLYAAPRAA